MATKNKTNKARSDALTKGICVRNSETKKRKNRNNGEYKRNVTSYAEDIRSDANKKTKHTKNLEKQKQGLSLASKLKRLRGTAESTPSPPEWSNSKSTKYKFLSPENDSDFHSCLRESYRGFHWETPEQLPSSLHKNFNLAFSRLDDANLFQYDAVQPGRKRLSRTFVTRTLVGNPGSTYRYLGLRLFSHPWCDVDQNGDSLTSSSKPPTEHKMGRKNGEAKVKRKINNKRCSGSVRDGLSLEELGYSKDTVSALLTIGEINKTLINRSNQTLQTKISDSVPDRLVGSAEFSLTLINKMEPTSVKKDLKPETVYGMGKTSVSWHIDSGLQDFSTIAVYHELRDIHHTGVGSDGEQPWRVALRVSDNGDNATPPLAVPLPSGSLYYLLDDFNHKHEHAVLSGSNMLRYSSTHRVAREGHGTWQYIRDKCDQTLALGNKETGFLSFMNETNASLRSGTNVNFAAGERMTLAKDVRRQQQLLTEIEFEWIQQWMIQGQLHADSHPYWHAPMAKLLDCKQQLETWGTLVVKLLEKATSSISPYTDIASERLFDVMIEALEERIRLRKTWYDRLNDPIFKTMDPEMRPIVPSNVDNKNLSVHNLTNTVDNIRSWRTKCVELKNKETSSSSKGHSRATNSRGKDDGNRREKSVTSLTRKEQRKLPSNWEKMKLSMLNSKKQS